MTRTKELLILVCIAIVIFMTVSYQLMEYSNYNIFLLIIICTAVLMISLSISIIKEKKIDEMFVFKLIMPIIAAIFILAMPIFKSHDEDVHWLRIYDISLGNFFTKTDYGFLFQEDAVNYPTAEIPNAVALIIAKTYDGSSIKDIFDVKINEEETTIYAMPRTAVYSPIQYLPQVTGVVLARLFTDRPIIMAYAARIMNILVCFTFLYFAMKFMPFGKKLLLVLMTIPITLEGLTSMTHDGITVAASFFFIAYVLHLIYDKKDEKLSSKQILIILFTSILIALCKIVYIPIVGLVLLLPKTKFNSRKAQIIIISIIIGIALITNLCWLSISSSYLAEYEEGRPVIQLGKILQNPFNYLKTFIYSIDYNGSKYFTSTFGGEAGLNEFVIMNTMVPVVFFILCLIATFGTREEFPKLTIFQGIIMALIFLAVVGLIFTSLYIQWTNPDEKAIKGVQGRYFIPILPFLFILLSQLKIKMEYSETKILKIITVGILMIQIYVIPLVYSIRKYIL